MKIDNLRWFFMQLGDLAIQAPSSDFLVIDGPGHNLQYSTPKESVDVVKYVLEQ